MSDHSVRVVRIKEILPHKNADRLEIIPVEGFQVVSGKGQFKIGDLAYYVPPDSIVPERPEFEFVWLRDGGGNLRSLAPGVPVPDKWRRITVRKLRKEWSEGLLMPLGSLVASEGDDVAEALGIMHYDPPEPEESGNSAPSRKQSKVWPRSLCGWIYFLSYWLTLGLYNPWGQLGGGNEKAPPNTPPIYDVENLKHFRDVFQPGDEVRVTEKIHGANARYHFSGHQYAGSRKLWKSKKDASVWRKILACNPGIARWCEMHPGYTLYAEAVPVQKSSSGFDYDYGATKDNPQAIIFDVRNAEGEWVNYELAREITAGWGLQWAPLLYQGPYDYEKLKALADGNTATGGNHIREGVVIRSYPDRYVRGLGRAQLKIVSNKFLELEGQS